MQVHTQEFAAENRNRKLLIVGEHTVLFYPVLRLNDEVVYKRLQGLLLCIKFYQKKILFASRCMPD